MRIKNLAWVALIVCLTMAAYNQVRAAECCGGEPLQKGEQCCDGVAFDPSPTGSETASADLTAIINVARGIFANSGRCSVSSPGSTKIEYTHENVKLCCDDEIKTVKRISGGGNISMGGIECHIPGPGSIIGLAEWGATLGGGMSFQATFTKEPECDAPSKDCFNIGVSGSFEGGVYGEIITEDFVGIKGVVTAGLSVATNKWCTDGSTERGDICLKVEGSFSVKVITLFEDKWTGTWWEKCS